MNAFYHKRVILVKYLFQILDVKTDDELNLQLSLLISSNRTPQPNQCNVVKNMPSLTNGDSVLTAPDQITDYSR